MLLSYTIVSTIVSIISKLTCKMQENRVAAVFLDKKLNYIFILYIHTD